MLSLWGLARAIIVPKETLHELSQWRHPSPSFCPGHIGLSALLQTHWVLSLLTRTAPCAGSSLRGFTGLPHFPHASEKHAQTIPPWSSTSLPLATPGHLTTPQFPLWHSSPGDIRISGFIVCLPFLSKLHEGGGCFVHYCIPSPWHRLGAP